ncbi:MAG TPA: hemolysin family protein [Ferruginibacter sp.]|nr:HlyC/CorC family transporter [Bacteroidota bacterium]MCC6692065.1 HlyC/CorC family transporter [Chitinophagaceae bacterium]HMT95398.1 hemolysin family protein [Ferruginibacter sp.]HMU23761.1 hemolysin family protein [Ferruginibacter sp.]
MTEIFILALLIFLNALFVMSEIALVSSRRTKLETMANKGDVKAKAALALSENPERFLSTAQIGITLISILTGVYSGEKFGNNLKPFIENVDLLRPYASGIATSVVVILVTILSIIFGELIPKKFGLLRAEKIARIVAGPMNILSRLMMPIVWLLSGATTLIFKLLNIEKASNNAVTEEEIKAMVAEGSEFGEIEEDEKEIIERVFHLGDRNITSLMTHRTDIVWVEINQSVEDVKNRFDNIVFSTYPVCEESIDNIKGLVYIKDLFKAKPQDTMKQLCKPALFVPENNKAYQLLEKMKETKIHTSFIVNEYGTLEGMITLNDILEAIVGEVPQTDQEEYEITRRNDGSFLVDAQIHFYNFLSYFDRADWMNEGEQEFDTVAGFVLHELEHIPHAGETFEWRDFKFEIVDMDGQRIDKIMVTISEELKEELEEE